MPPNSEIPARWSLSDIPFDRIDLSQLRDREDLLCLLAGSSFIEFASETYAGQLAGYCRDDPEIAAWLSEHWGPEERLHGRALRAYIEHAWPEFPWQAAFDGFFIEYARICGAETYEPTRGLEMVARCVIETGTATCYQSIRELADEPVLKQLAERIRGDEVRHYKHFLHYFDRFNRHENNSPLRVLGALRRRVAEVRGSDVETGLWHAFTHLHPRERRDGQRFAVVRRQVIRMLAIHYPIEQAVRMLLQPLRLSRLTRALVRPPVALAAAFVRAALLR